MKPTGYVIYRGFSPINDKPYVAIITITSSNRKTGAMAQVWILSDECNPILASERGLDESICGDCPHRRQADGSRSCYVNLGQAPLQIWKSYQAGKYPTLCDDNRHALSKALSGKSIRWGAYGDPGILPVCVFNDINSMGSGHTGYTHLWHYQWAQVYKGLFQASADGIRDQQAARSMGWHTFTVIPRLSDASNYAKQCPATVEFSQTQCITCKLCDGSKSNIFVHAHGPGAKYVTAH